MAQLCDTVTVQEPDESSGELLSIEATSPSANTLNVVAEIKNNITSGNGESISGEATVSVAGTEQHTEQIQVDPGNVFELAVTIEGVESGQKEACIDFLSNSLCDSTEVKQPQDTGGGGGGDVEDPSQPSEGDGGGNIGKVLAIAGAGLTAVSLVSKSGSNGDE